MSNGKSVSAPQLKVEHLNAQYGHRRRVLESVSFVCGPGVNLLVAPNGAGKTTLLSILSGAKKQASGRVHLDLGSGDLSVADRISRSMIGFMPQGQAFPPRMTVLECVEYVAWLRRVPGNLRRDRALKVLGSVHADHLISERWSRISYGMRQRVAIAAALVNQPSLLLLDEPLNGLDISERRSFIELLTGLPSEAIVLLSTHVVEGLENLPGSTVVLGNRTAIFSGSTQKLVLQHGSLEQAYLALQGEGRQ